MDDKQAPIYECRSGHKSRRRPARATAAFLACRSVRLSSSADGVGAQATESTAVDMLHVHEGRELPCPKKGAGRTVAELTLWRFKWLPKKQCRLKLAGWRQRFDDCKEHCSAGYRMPPALHLWRH